MGTQALNGTPGSAVLPAFAPAPAHTPQEEISDGRRIWTDELDAILRSGYSRGWIGAREAVKKILHLHPDWPRSAIWKRAARLGLTHKRPNPLRSWSKSDEKILLDFAGEYSARTLAKKLQRSEAAVRRRLLLCGESAKVCDGFTRRDLARDVGVSPKTIRRWISLGWLKLRDGRITERSFEDFCQTHASEIDCARLSRGMLEWLGEFGFIPISGQSAKWRAVRKHTTVVRTCRKCSRRIKGNAFYRHAKHCQSGAQRAA